MSTSEWMLKYLMRNLQGEHFHLIKDQHRNQQSDASLWQEMVLVVSKESKVHGKV